MRWPSTPSRIALAALAVSLAVHGALLAGVPGAFGTGSEDGAPAATYIATLSAPESAAPAAGPIAAPMKPVVHRALRKLRASAPKVAIVTPPEAEVAATERVGAPAPEAVIAQASASEDTAPAESVGPVALLAPPPPEPVPQRAAVAAALEPMGPPDLPDAAAIEPDHFPTQALPSDLEIGYALSSAIAKAHAVYRWKREGDRYRITGEGEADGFFSLFLEGRMIQESEGTVTASGLRPERFVEKKPNAQDEGLDFDWNARQVTFDLGDKRKTARLAENSVDWLSMIFQLAHVPPSGDARDMKLSVLTQRRLYRFDLKVLGTEEITVPMGRLRALHLRHVDPDDGQAVDVWLGIEQHYLPVKLRYPVARNRLIVEQSAISLSAR